MLGKGAQEPLLRGTSPLWRQRRWQLTQSQAKEGRRLPGQMIWSKHLVFEKALVVVKMEEMKHTCKYMERH